MGMSLTKLSLVLINNASAITIAQNNMLSNKTRHIQTNFHFIKECVQDGILQIQHVSTHENPADMLTKPLPRDKINKFCNKHQMKTINYESSRTAIEILSVP